jgi:phospholipid/cholesterol/gamma-HCH transport system ATP-binding protein
MNCVKLAADRVVILVDGICYANGTYQQLLSSTDKKIHQFFE